MTDKATIFLCRYIGDPVVGAGLPAPSPADQRRPAWTRFEVWCYIYHSVIGEVSGYWIGNWVNLDPVVDARRFNWSSECLHKFLAELSLCGLIDEVGGDPEDFETAMSERCFGFSVVGWEYEEAA